jgi:predicted permease
VPISPDSRIYVVALILALLSGLLFGIVPVRQVFRGNPYEIVKAGPSGRIGRRFTVRDALLVVQIALCAVLVTSSAVALRGLGRSMHANLGFQPNTMLVGTNLIMAGYSGDSFAAMQKRSIERLESIPGVEQVGLINNFPPLIYAAASRVNVFKEGASDLRPSNVAGSPFRYDVSPKYFAAAGTALLAGRDFNWDDDKEAPPVSVVNREFAARSFGSVANAVGKYYKLQDGTRVQVVGVVEDGKYLSLTEEREPAIFLPSLRSPVGQSYMVVRSQRNPQELAAALRTRMRELDSALPLDIATWSTMLDVALFPARVATVALGVLGMMGAVLSISGIFGMATYSVSKRLRELGIRVALGAQRREVLHAALGRAFRLLAIGSAAGLLLGMLATKILAYIVYQATPRDPAVFAAVVLTMAVLGLVSTWIPARRALSVNPLILLREE